MYLCNLAAISYNNDIIRYNKFVTGVQPRFQALTSCGGKTLVGSGHVIKLNFVKRNQIKLAKQNASYKIKYKHQMFINIIN